MQDAEDKPDSPSPRRLKSAGSASTRRSFWQRPKASPEDVRGRRIRHWSEVWETIIVTLATVATVWAGYQAGLWNNEQMVASNQATTLRLGALELNNRGYLMRSIDVGLFTDWVDAYVAGNSRLADFYRERFRDEFLPAMDAWIATDPLNNPDAPHTPFEMPEYRLVLLELADDMMDKAGQREREGENAGSIGDQYTLAVVILAASLLLAGVANRFEWEELRIIVVAAALLVLAFSIFSIIRLPVT